jgi:hypothetical protein
MLSIRSDEGFDFRIRSEGRRERGEWGGNPSRRGQMTAEAASDVADGRTDGRTDGQIDGDPRRTEWWVTYRSD